MLTGRLIENSQIVSAFSVGTDVNTDADGDWVSLKNYNRCLILFTKAIGTAGDDVSIKLEQATAVAGTSAKALTFNHIYHKIGATALSGVGQWTKVNLSTATDDLDLVSVNSVDLATDINETMIAVEIHASDLDVSGGFDCLHIYIEGDDLSAAALAGCYYILYDPRFADNATPSAIAD
jgi:hypothetical protein